MTPGLLGWVIILIVGLVWEAIAILRGDTTQWPTLTRVIKTHAPRWILAAALGWVVYHFLS